MSSITPKQVMGLFLLRRARFCLPHNPLFHSRDGVANIDTSYSRGNLCNKEMDSARRHAYRFPCALLCANWRGTSQICAVYHSNTAALVLLAARIPGKLMEWLDENKNLARSAGKIAVSVTIVLIVLYTLLFSISLDGVMARKDNRDAALAWIRKNIPPGSSIAVPTIPWFYTPPLDPRFGYGSAQIRFEAAQSVAEYAIVTDENQEWNWRLLRDSEPDFVILSEFEYEDRLRIGDQAAIDYFAILHNRYRLVRQFDSPPSIFGRKFPLLVELPHDMSYANPTIQIYARNDIF